MSSHPMTVATMVRTLEKVGEPLTSDQRNALENEGHRQMKEIRAEMREIVKTEFKVDNEAMRRAINEIAKSEVQAHLTGGVSNILRQAVKDEMDRQLKNTGGNLAEVVRNEIMKAAGDYAKQRIDNAINITVKDHW